MSHVLYKIGILTEGMGLPAKVCNYADVQSKHTDNWTIETKMQN